MKPDTNLSILREFLLQHLGLYFTERQEKDLYRKMQEAAVAFGHQDVDAFIVWLVNQYLTKEQTERLAEFLTIGETYFLREKHAYNYLEFEYLPRIIAERRAHNNKKLKLWSAGCASGEEPYTLAILLKRILPDIKEWDITILATDINPAFLAKARHGVYSKWSFRKAPRGFIEHNFEEIEPGRFKIDASLRQLVSFSYLNLVDDVFPSVETNTHQMDVIFCRNVMIYFSPEGIERVGNKLYDCICSSGILITSPVEVSNMQRSRFNVSLHSSCHVFNKESRSCDAEPVRNGRLSSVSNANTDSSQEIFEKLAKLSRVTREKKAAEKAAEKTARVADGFVRSSSEDYSKALALYHQDKLEEAEHMLKQMLQMQEGLDENSKLLLARIMANNGKLEAANDLCKRVIEVNPVNASAYYLQAVVYYELGQKAEAIRAAENVLFLQPNYVLAHYLLGCIRMSEEDERYSKQHFNNLKRLLNAKDPDDLIDDVDRLTVKQLSNNIALIQM